MTVNRLRPRAGSPVRRRYESCRHPADFLRREPTRLPSDRSSPNPGARRCPASRKNTPRFVKRQQHYRPAMAGAEDIPWPQNRRREAGLFDHRLAKPTNPKIGAHHRRRLRHAHIHEMADAHASRRIHRCANRSEIDFFELFCLGGIGMGRADEVDDSVVRPKSGGNRIRIESIADHRLRSRRYARQ